MSRSHYLSVPAKAWAGQVRATAKLFQRYARTYLAHQKLLDWREVDDPELTNEKKRDVSQSIICSPQLTYVDCLLF